MRSSIFLFLLPLFTAGLLLIGCGNESAAPGETANLPFQEISPLPAGFDAQGHRGARGLRPENSLPAFEAALDLGVTTLEADLHFTADGKIVVWHDPMIEKSKCRLVDNAETGAPDPRNPLRRILISQQPLAVVQSYTCDLNPDPDRYPDQTAAAAPLAGRDYRIITLGELFDFVDAYAASSEKSDLQRANAAAVQFNLETKRRADHPEFIDDGFTGGEAGPFELAILAEINRRGLTERVILQSFDHASLRAFRTLDPDIRLAALTTGGEAKIKVYWGYGFDIWSPNFNDLTPERIAEAHELGLQVIPWTVNEPETMAELVNLGVDGLISDRPDLLLSLDPP